MYSGTGIVAAQGGVLAASYGAHLLDGRKSTRARRTGSALVAAGAAMMGAAVLDAVRVKAEREMLLEFDAAFRRDMRGAPSVDSPLPPPLPPPPIIPWEFMEKSPLAGEGP